MLRVPRPLPPELAALLLLLPLVGLALTSALGAAAASTAWFSARPLAGHVLLDAALLCALAVLGPMPAIGADAFIPAGTLAVLLAVRQSEAARWRIAIRVLAGGGVAPAANDNPLLARAA